MENSTNTIQHEHGEGCRELLNQLSDYLDGVLSIELCSEIEQHLKTCKNCTIVVDTLKKTIELYQETAKSEKMPSEVRQRLYKCLDLEDYQSDVPDSSKNDH